MAYADYLLSSPRANLHLLALYVLSWMEEPIPPKYYESIRLSLSQGLQNIHGFELGPVYERLSDKLPEDLARIARDLDMRGEPMKPISLGDR